MIHDAKPFLNQVTLPSFSCDACTYKDECGWCFDDGDHKGSGTCVMHYTNDTNLGDSTSFAEYGRCWKNTSNSDSFQFQNSTTLYYYGYCPTTLSWLPILGMVLYLCCFSAGKRYSLIVGWPQQIVPELFLGYGPMPWVINA